MSELLTLENTAIVIDSTSDPPAEVVRARRDLRMVPLKVHFGDETYRDGVDLTPAEFFAKLGLPRCCRPHRSRPWASSRRVYRERASATSMSSRSTSPAT